MNAKMTLIAMAIATVATPSVAQSNTAETKQSGSTAATAKEKKYCIAYESLVGSRLNRQECRTKQEWERKGVNVDKMVNQ